MEAAWDNGLTIWLRILAGGTLFWQMTAALMIMIGGEKKSRGLEFFGMGIRQMVKYLQPMLESGIQRSLLS